jgi:preprotein translocase subunit SecE
MSFWPIFFILAIVSLALITFGYSLAGYVALGFLAVAFFLRYRAAIFKFVGEVKVELDKCSWPWDPNLTGFKKYKELIESTVVVVISVILLAGFVTTSDFVLAHVVGFITGTQLAK